MEKIDTEDGKEVFVTITDVPTSLKEDAFERPSFTQSQKRFPGKRDELHIQI